ncbi:hypothetical protein [Paracraurococcus lichenis]|uniref:Uncharacterized protein n=1 Tax=Paracraurococcus lichenis TaxID=3064888 RepID=A0ABT9E3U8_9PROT|nr:hypothetical protein [Paracraurococcus sp. LOR1-02]MDO9710787.1 hypothetical protein [Paracraurococcus sp. LOR1-02]
MSPYRPRLWLGLGLSVLAAGGMPALAADPACQPAAQVPLGEAGESGEGEGGPATPAARALVLDRMAAQIAAGATARAAGDADSAEILVAAATDEGPARLARRGDGPDPALEAALAPLAAAPGDAAAGTAALRAVEQALATTTTPIIERAAGMTAAALEAFTAALDCGRLADRAAYAEAGALVRRARAVLAGLPGDAVREMAGDLDRLAALLPPAPPEPPPATGAVSALVSHALLAASDAGR